MFASRIASSATALGAIVAVVLMAATLHAQDAGDLSLDSLLSRPVHSGYRSLQITTASKAEELMIEAPASITLITSDDIARFGYRTLDEVLASVRGFYLSYDRNYTYVGMRGFSRPTDYNNRILLLLNGHTLNEDFYGSALLGPECVIDLPSVDHIEIVRGPGSTLYGSGAMLCVINIIMKQGTYAEGAQVNGGLGTSGARQGGGSYAGRIADGPFLAVSARWFDNAGADLHYPEYDTVGTTRGIAHGRDWERGAGIHASLEWDALTVQGFWSQREKGVPTGAFETVFDDPRARTFDGRGFAELQYRHDFSPSIGTMIRAYVDAYSYHGGYPYPDALQTDTNSSRWFGAELQAHWRPIVGNHLVLGLEYADHAHDEYAIFDGPAERSRMEYPYTVFSAYAQDQQQFTPELSVTAGVRHDRYSYLHTSVSPRGALVYSYSDDGSLKLLAGQAFRAPNLYERYYSDPGTSFVANPDLTREQIFTLELVNEHRVARQLFATASLYNYTMDNLIDTREFDGSQLHFVNVGRIRSVGAELGVSWRGADGGMLYANYAVQRSRGRDADDDGESEISNSPSHLVRIGGATPAWNGLSCAVEAQWQASRLTVRDDIRTDPFFLVDLTATYRPDISGRSLVGDVLSRLSVVLRVKNLFDASWATPAGFEHLQPSILQDGRTIHVLVSASL